MPMLVHPPRIILEHISVEDMKTHENKSEGLSLTSKQGTRQDYVIQKQEHKN
jgi:hypothetical protein